MTTQTPPSDMELQVKNKNHLDKINSYKRLPTVDYSTTTMTKASGRELLYGWIDMDFTVQNAVSNGAYFMDTATSVIPYGNASFLSGNGTLDSGEYLFIIKFSSNYYDFSHNSGSRSRGYKLGWSQGVESLTTKPNNMVSYYDSDVLVGTNRTMCLVIRRRFTQATRLQFDTNLGGQVFWDSCSIFPLSKSDSFDGFYRHSYTPKMQNEGRESWYFSKRYTSFGANSYDGYFSSTVANSWSDSLEGNEFYTNTSVLPETFKYPPDVRGNPPSLNVVLTPFKDPDYGVWWYFRQTYATKEDYVNPSYIENLIDIRSYRGSEGKPATVAHFNLKMVGGVTNYPDAFTSGYAIRALDYIDADTINPLTTKDLTRETFLSKRRFAHKPLCQGSFYIRTKYVQFVQEISFDFFDIWKQTPNVSSVVDLTNHNWNLSNFAGKIPKVAFITVYEIGSPPSPFSATTLKAGSELQNYNTLKEHNIGLGGLFSGLVVFDYPVGGDSNPYVKLPSVTIISKGTYMPALQIEMHVLEWGEF